MTAYEFIFSGKRKHRFIRHAAFWIVLCLLKFYSGLYPTDLKDLLNPDVYKQSLSSLICFIPLHVFSAYSFSCILLPAYLQKKKYAAFITAFLAVALVNFIGGIFLSKLFFKIMEWQMTGTNKFLAPLRTSIYHGVMLAFFVTGGIVTAIKLTKKWYLQQVQNSELAKQKKEKEVKMLRSQIQPVFLFHSLNILHTKIISGENDAPMMVLQLSELLSCLLYDCNNQLIPLNQELRMTKLLVDIREFDKHHNFSIKIFVHGDDSNKYISSLLVFSHLQTVLNDSDETMSSRENLDIILNIGNKTLLCELRGCINTVTQFILYDFSESLKTAGNSIILYA